MCLSSGTKKNQYLYILFSIDKRNYNFEWIDFTYTVCNKVLHSLEVVVQSGLNMEKNSHIKGTTKCFQKSKETTLTYWRNIFWVSKIAIFCGKFLSTLGYITSHIISLISVFLIPYNTTHDMFWSNLFSSFSFTSRTVSQYYHDHIYPWTVPIFLPIAQISLTASVYTTVVTCFDRYIAICRPALGGK